MTLLALLKVMFMAESILIGFVAFLIMKVYTRFEKTEERAKITESRTEKIEVAVTQLTVWAHTTDTKLDHLEKRVEKIEIKLDRMDEKFEKKFDQIIGILLSQKSNSKLKKEIS